MKRRFSLYVFPMLLLLLGGLLPALSVSVSAQERIGKQNMKKYDGIDVSHHQGEIDWKQVAQDNKIKFVYIKATQGTTITDRRYAENIRGARRRGLKCGSYHFLSSQTPVRKQFAHFKSVVKKRQQDLIPMVDVESEGVRGWTKKQVCDSLALFCRLVKQQYGKSPLIYTQFKFYNTHLSPRFDRYFLFLGKYSWPQPRIKGSSRHNIWQYSEHGKIKGIKGYVDLDRFVSGTRLKDIKL